MNDLPLHPKLVHLPMALAVLVPLLAATVLLAWWRGWFRHRTWVLVAAAQVLLFASGMVAVRTGKQDEHVAERAVPEAAIEAHEEAAEAFQLAAGVVLALCVLPLLLRRPRLAQLAALTATAGTVVVLFLGIRVGAAGGELVYRHNAGAAHAAQRSGGAPATPAVPRAPREHDDDHR